MAGIIITVDADDLGADYQSLRAALDNAVTTFGIAAPDWPLFVVKNPGTMVVYATPDRLGTCPYFEIVAHEDFYFRGVINPALAYLSYGADDQANITIRAMTILRGIQFASTGTNNAITVVSEGGLAFDTDIEDCAFISTGSSRCFSSATELEAASNLVVKNSLMVGGTSGIWTNNSANNRFYQYTIVDNDVGLDRPFGTVNFYNCLFGGNTDDFIGIFVFNEGTDWNGSNNIVSGSYAPGSGSIADATFTFEDAVGGDYRLAESDSSGAEGGGADLSATAYPVPFDVGGRVRPTFPTIGMWELAPVLPTTGDNNPIMFGMNF
jgi:hypothetical protein